MLKTRVYYEEGAAKAYEFRGVMYYIHHIKGILLDIFKINYFCKLFNILKLFHMSANVGLGSVRTLHTLPNPGLALPHKMITWYMNATYAGITDYLQKQQEIANYIVM